MKIEQVNHLGSNYWNVVYSSIVGCCGMVDRKSFIMRSKKRPTDKQIQEEINKPKEDVKSKNSG